MEKTHKALLHAEVYDCLQGKHSCLGLQTELASFFWRGDRGLHEGILFWG